MYCSIKNYRKIQNQRWSSALKLFVEYSFSALAPYLDNYYNITNYFNFTKKTNSVQ